MSRGGFGREKRENRLRMEFEIKEDLPQRQRLHNGAMLLRDYIWLF